MAYIDTKYLFECETCRRNRTGMCDTWCESGECYQPDMSKIPIADVEEVKHGEWIRPTKLANMMHDIPHCSLCGEVPCDEGKYCPSCGAEMDGGKTDV